MKLKTYLQQHYPHGSKEYKTMILVFVNDYNQSLKREYATAICKVDTPLYKRCMSAELFGVTQNGIYDWIEFLDADLFMLVTNYKEGNAYAVLCEYFGASNFNESSRNVGEVLEGIQIVEQSSNEPPQIIYKSRSSDRFSLKPIFGNDIEYKLCVTDTTICYEHKDFGKEFLHIISPTQTKKQILYFLSRLFSTNDIVVTDE